MSLEGNLNSFGFLSFFGTPMKTVYNELRYILYARKSSESEDRQMASVEDQVIEMKRFAEERGLNVITVIKESKSAKNVGRKHFNDMLLQIQEGKADAILCWKLNRLARNPIDGGSIIDLLQRNILKHVQTNGRDYRPTDNVIMMYVEFGMSNQFSNDLSMDVRRGMRMKAERGWNPARQLPIGYIHNKDKNGKVLPQEIIPDPKRFINIKKLWKKMLLGSYSVADMKRTGDKLGLTNDKKRPYGLKAYHNIFNSRFYCGYFKWKDKDGISIEYKGKHKTIISELEYEKVQRILGNNSNPTRQRNYQYVFKGLLSCGECGASITAERKLNLRCRECKHKFSCINRDDCPKCSTKISEMENPHITNIVYYRCTKKKGPCLQKAITETDLKAQYLSIAKEFQISKPFYDVIVNDTERYHETKNEEHKTFFLVQKQQLSELNSRLNSLALMRADGEISKEEYISIKQTTLELIEEKKALVSEYTYEQQNWKQQRLRYAEFGYRAIKVLKNKENHVIKELLSTLGSNQKLMDKKLYFIREEPLLEIKKGYRLYTAKKSGFEPENSLILQGDLDDLDD